MSGYTLQISVLLAVSSSLGLSFLFVASLYFWTLVGYGNVGRDEPGTIQRRFVSTLLTCACSTVLIFWLAQPAHGSEGFTRLELLGLQVEGLLRACLACLALTASLFAGPILQGFLACYTNSSTGSSDTIWIRLRGLVMAPITEEFVFRACLMRLCVAAQFPMWANLVFSPACFALAHAHHFIEHVRKAHAQGLIQGGRANGSSEYGLLNAKHVNAAVRRAVVEVAFQMFYTSLFGIYSCFLLLRTGSTVAVILAHAFCNYQGFPDFGFYGHYGHPLYRYRLLIGVMYIVGIVAFCILMMPITSGCDSPFHLDAA